MLAPGGPNHQAVGQTDRVKDQVGNLSAGLDYCTVVLVRFKVE